MNFAVPKKRRPLMFNGRQQNGILKTGEATIFEMAYLRKTKDFQWFFDVRRGIGVGELIAHFCQFQKLIISIPPNPPKPPSESGYDGGCP